MSAQDKVWLAHTGDFHQWLTLKTVADELVQVIERRSGFSDSDTRCLVGL